MGDFKATLTPAAQQFNVKITPAAPAPPPTGSGAPGAGAAFSGVDNNGVNGGTEVFFNLWGSVFTTSINPPNATDGNYTPSPVSGDLKNLSVLLSSAAQAATGPCVCTLMVNGVDTPVSVTIPAGGDVGTYSDFTNSFAVVKGDQIALHITNNAPAPNFANVLSWTYAIQ
jgi:hypothetical protein